MVFSAALTGISASSSELSVIGNNIANSATTGFKSSRAEFGDIYTSAAGSASIGAGVQITGVKQVHEQGNIQFTDNNLDLAISGEGFFVLSDNGSSLYSRAGSFGLDKDGYIVNSSGKILQGLLANADGSFQQQTSDLQIDTSSSPPNATAAIGLALNLDASAEVPSVGTFDPDDDASFNNLSSSTIYDGLGTAHTLTSYYVKTADNTWDVHFHVIDSATNARSDITPASNTLVFADTGRIATPVAGSFNLNTFSPSGGAATMDMSMYFDGSTAPEDIELSASTSQFATDFSVQATTQDGYASGRIEDLEIAGDGRIVGRFSNGTTRDLGQVQLANFRNPEGLRPSGDSTWTESPKSGVPTVGTPTTGSLGTVNAGALEQSNVDLTAELVALITAQRNFQANAQTIRTGDTISQTIINLR